MAQRGGVSSLRCLQATRNSEIVIEVDIGDDNEPAQWTYVIGFNARKGEEPSVVREVVKKSGKTILNRPELKTDANDPALLSQT
ncbi:AAA family ATPase, partial [Acinetobacter baumannii]